MTSKIPATLMQKYLKKASICIWTTTTPQFLLHCTTLRMTQKELEQRGVVLNKEDSTYFQNDKFMIMEFRIHKDNSS